MCVGGALVYCTLGNEKKKKKEENKRNLLRVHCEWVLFLYYIGYAALLM